MTILAVTSHTWLVTGLGFGLVLVLLFIFVYIMKFLGYVMQPKKKAAPAEAPKVAPKTYAQDADGATRAAIAMSLYLSDSEADMAAVAFALNLYYGVHDITPSRLNITPRATTWNSKAFNVNNLIK